MYLKWAQINWSQDHPRAKEFLGHKVQDIWTSLLWGVTPKFQSIQFDCTLQTHRILTPQKATLRIIWENMSKSAMFCRNCRNQTGLFGCLMKHGWFKIPCSYQIPDPCVSINLDPGWSRETNKTRDSWRFMVFESPCCRKAIPYWVLKYKWLIFWNDKISNSRNPHIGSIANYLDHWNLLKIHCNMIHHLCKILFWTAFVPQVWTTRREKIANETWMQKIGMLLKGWRFRNSCCFLCWCKLF